jgi:hypothetical protein
LTEAQGQCQSIFDLQVQNAKMAIGQIHKICNNSENSEKRHASNLKMPPSLSADSLTLPSQMGVV